jgi:hypothetical protein
MTEESDCLTMDEPSMPWEITAAELAVVGVHRV